MRNLIIKLEFEEETIENSIVDVTDELIQDVKERCKNNLSLDDYLSEFIKNKKYQVLSVVLETKINMLRKKYSIIF
jgi:flagellar basal body rod protein FlgB